SGAAESLERGAVGLIEGSLKDVWQSRIGRDLRDFFRHGAGVCFGFNDAGPGNQEQGIAAAEAQLAKFDFACRAHKIWKKARKLLRLRRPRRVCNGLGGGARRSTQRRCGLAFRDARGSRTQAFFLVLERSVDKSGKEQLRFERLG